jgi:hypothetical protein
MDLHTEKDGIINPDSEFGKEIGFTSDLFGGYLWKSGERIVISLAESLKQNKGNLSKLFSNIEKAGFEVVVPTPLGKMQSILIHKGFGQFYEYDNTFGVIEVWKRR